ncbi:MAG: hypothetical protein K2V38_28410, partial [Gemmataceae bacterium]|nr:hypothetical protein [Gemmataceae bacterium]
MRFVRLPLAFAITAVAVVLCEAQTQPPAALKITPTPLAVVAIDAIDDPAVVADLKLTDDQKKSLVARRQEVWDEQYTTGVKAFAEGAAERNKATDALLKKTLSDDQYKRAVQLGAQQVLRTPTFPGAKGKDAGEPTFRLTRLTATILTRYPELQPAFKLTDDQKKQLTAPPATKGGKNIVTGILMSEEQVAAAEKFLGPVVKGVSSKTDPRVSAIPTKPANFTLLEAKDVRNNLKISESNAKTFGDLAEKWQKLTTAQFTELSPKEAAAQATALKAETEKALASLTPEQAKRLEQINTQAILNPALSSPFALQTVQPIHIETSYSNTTVTKELALTPEQAKQFAALRSGFEKDAAAVLLKAEAADAAEKKLAEMVKTRQGKAEAVLTAEQATKWKELVGAPFTGSTRPDRLGNVPSNFGPFAGSPVVARRYATFGNHTDELTELASNKSIQDELKMKPEQIKKAGELRDEVAKITLPNLQPPTVEDYRKAYTERSKAVAAGIAKVLDEDQAKRFRQIMLQTRELAGQWVVSAVSYPGVAEAVKLTEENRNKMILGTASAEVLTDEQKSAIKKMLGEPFKGTMPGGVAKVGGGPLTLTPVVQVFLNNTDRSDDLKLTDAQKEKLMNARRTFSLAVQEIQNPNGGPPTDIA